MALVELLLSPLPSHVRTARLVVVAAARRAGLDDEHVDELRLALGEACSRAVGLHARHAPGTPVQVTIDDDPRAVTVTVTDVGPPAGPAPQDLAEDLLGGASDGPAGDGSGDGSGDGAGELVHPDVALAVLTGLVDDVDITPGATGTTVRMRWPLPPGGATSRSTAASQA
jgi:serine/threonine-protein kinase RsbW